MAHSKFCLAVTAALLGTALLAGCSGKDASSAPAPSPILVSPPPLATSTSTGKKMMPPPPDLQPRPNGNR